jgi:hypothetical protein
MKWIEKDPDCGYQIASRLAATHRYEDNGLTLVEEFPKHYFQAPDWAVWVLDLTDKIHGLACWLCSRWDPEYAAVQELDNGR